MGETQARTKTLGKSQFLTVSNRSRNKICPLSREISALRGCLAILQQPVFRKGIFWSSANLKEKTPVVSAQHLFSLMHFLPFLM